MKNPKESRCRHAKIALFVVSTIILIEIAWPAYYIVPRILYSRKREQITETIGSWAKNDAKLTPEWESLSVMVRNVCYSAEVVSFHELNKLLAEVKRLDHLVRDRSTVDFLWNYLEGTSSHGKAMVTRYKTYQDAADGENDGPAGTQLWDWPDCLDFFRVASWLPGCNQMGRRQ